MEKQFKNIMDWKHAVSEAEYEKYLLAAGIRTDNFSIVQQVLEKKPSLKRELENLCADNTVYGPYDKLAATFGGKGILEYLVTFETRIINKSLRLTYFEGAARAGRAEMIGYIYSFRKVEVPWRFSGNS
jgi:CRISPR/Cas system-associated protein endoribonuclease Cas2